MRSRWVTVTPYTGRDPTPGRYSNAQFGQKGIRVVLRRILAVS